MIIRFTIGKSFWALLAGIMILGGISAAILSGESVYLIGIFTTAAGAAALVFVLSLPATRISLHTDRNAFTNQTHDGK